MPSISHSEGFVFDGAMVNFWDAANIPKRHKNKPEGKSPEWGAMLEEIYPLIGSGFIAAFLGGRGTGKTQMAVEVIRETCKKSKSAFYVKAVSIFLRLRESMRENADRSERFLVKELAAYDLLVIDALEVRGESGWEDRILDHVLDLRYDAMRDTVLVSNHTREGFAKSVGPSIVSRIHETGKTFEMNWKSFREG